MEWDELLSSPDSRVHPRPSRRVWVLGRKSPRTHHRGPGREARKLGENKVVDFAERRAGQRRCGGRECVCQLGRRCLIHARHLGSSQRPPEASRGSFPADRRTRARSEYAQVMRRAGCAAAGFPSLGSHLCEWSCGGCVRGGCVQRMRRVWVRRAKEVSGRVCKRAAERAVSVEWVRDEARDWIGSALRALTGML